VHVGKVGCKDAVGVHIGSKEIVSTSRVQSASGLQIELQRDLQVEVWIDLSWRRVCFV